jgi:hypothetical protein
MWQNWVLRKIVGRKWEEVRKTMRNLCGEEIYTVLVTMYYRVIQ